MNWVNVPHLTQLSGISTERGKMIRDIFERVVKDEEYKKVREHPRLKYLQYVSLAGSYSYGTNTETSDIDIRGFYFLPLKDAYRIGGKFEDDVTFLTTDSVFYSFHQFIRLLIACNPNVVEFIGVEPDSILYMSQVGKAIRNNSERFLSKRALTTFAGYATQQLRRLENALARDYYPQAEKEKHILQSLEAEILAASDAFKLFNKDNTINLHIESSEREDMDAEILMDLNLKNVPIRDFVTMKNQFSNMLRNYGKLNHRNHKKDDNHLYKHAMHLIRLYYMGMDILREHRIQTYRHKEHDLLMSIRHGEYPLDKVFELQKKLEIELQKARDESTLPEKVDIDWVNKFVIDEIEYYSVNPSFYEVAWNVPRGGYRYD